jgi:integrase
VSAFKRGDKWVAKFTLKGKQHWVPGGPWARKSHALEAERRYRDRLRHRRTEETCASFADRWLEEWPRKAASTRRNYAEAIKRFVDEFGPTPLAEVERLSARTWALSVPRNVYRVAAIMYSDALNVGLVESNPFSNLRLPAERKEGIVIAPTLEEFRSLLAACSVLGDYGKEFRALLTFSAWTGLRSGEVQGLQWSDVEENRIHVRRQRTRDGSLTPPKSGYPRTIAFLPQARVLDQVPRRPDDFIFHAPRGNPLFQGSLFYAWKEVRSSAGLNQREGQKPLRFHDLRHFFAYRLKEQGLDPYTISKQMGHRDGGKLVIERYGMGTQEAANEKLLAAFAPKGQSMEEFAREQEIRRLKHG